MNSSAHFSILGHRKIKSQTELVNTRAHNNREVNVPNVDQQAEKPTVIYGADDTWVAVKSKMRELQIKPRKDAVLAIELMLTTSPDWWRRDDDGNVDRDQLQQWIVASVKYISDRFAGQAIISIHLHMDEETPHLHVVIMPLRERVDARFKDAEPRWTLCARGDLLGKDEKLDGTHWRGGVGGRAHLEFEHTKLAEYVAHLGLQRGRLGSQAVNKPNKVFRAEMTAAISAATLERESFGREREALVDATLEVGDEQAKIRSARGRIEIKQAAIDAQQAKLAADRQAYEAERADFLARREKFILALKERREAAEKREAAVTSREAQLRDELTAVIEREEALVSFLPALRDLVERVNPDLLPPIDRQRFWSNVNAFDASLAQVSKRAPRVARAYDRERLLSHASTLRQTQKLGR